MGGPGLRHDVLDGDFSWPRGTNGIFSPRRPLKIPQQLSQPVLSAEQQVNGLRLDCVAQLRIVWKSYGITLLVRERGGKRVRRHPVLDQLSGQSGERLVQ